MPATLHYRSHGKVNLYLDVLDRRPDGFTSIETVFQTVSLCDTLRFESRAEGITVTCSNPDVGPPEKNLAYRAAQLLLRECGENHGAAIHIDKQLPVAGGMAGGSSNGAAALVALNELWGLGLDTPRLCALALELGSDVPYCVVGGTMAATGRGEIFTPLPPLPETWFVLLHPPVAVSAGYVYQHPLLERSAETPRDGRTLRFAHAIGLIATGRAAEAVFNRMERPVFADHPAFQAALDELRALGCTAAAMSGSGPTLFGLCTDEAQARRIAAAITRYPARAVHSVAWGIERI
jgi:4-diphosphocytidyl-2-C-methyl-D-erythritol kinase